MTKPLRKRSTPRYKTLTFVGQLDCVSAKYALDFVSGELTKIPVVSGSLDFGLGQEMKRSVIYERLRPQLIEYIQHLSPIEAMYDDKGRNDVTDPGNDQDWFISLDSFKSFASSVGVEFALEVLEKIPLPELDPVPPVASLTREDLENYSLPKKVIKKQEIVEPALDINREIYILRKLQRSLIIRCRTMTIALLLLLNSP